MRSVPTLSLVLLSIVVSISCVFLGIVDLVCHYRSQVIGWKNSSLCRVEWDIKLHLLTHPGQ